MVLELLADESVQISDVGINSGDLGNAFGQPNRADCIAGKQTRICLGCLDCRTGDALDIVGPASSSVATPRFAAICRLLAAIARALAASRLQIT